MTLEKMVDQKKYDEYMKLFKEKGVPSDFDDWLVCNDEGWTVAHEAAKYGYLPIDDKLWDVADGCGITVLDVYSNPV